MFESLNWSRRPLRWLCGGRYNIWWKYPYQPQPVQILWFVDCRKTLIVELIQIYSRIDWECMLLSVLTCCNFLNTKFNTVGVKYNLCNVYILKGQTEYSPLSFFEGFSLVKPSSSSYKHFWKYTKTPVNN